MKRIGLAVAALILASALSGCSVAVNMLKRVVHRATPTPSITAATIEPAETATADAEPSPTPEEPTEEAATAEPTEAATAEPATAEPTPTPEPATPEPTADRVVYTSEYLGLSFSMPRSWAGWYYVFEGDGYLTVYFNPSEPADVDIGDGEFFSIYTKTENIDESMFDNSKSIDINGVTYIWGEPTDVRYQQGQSEYDTYQKMLEDLPGIQATVKAAD